MAETGNYQLNQWESTDRILREDFNADNAKVDQALGSLAATVAGCGNCNVAYGSYAGAGTGGANNPCTLTFDHKPLMVIVCANVRDNDRIILMQGCGYYFSDPQYPNSAGSVSWTENSVSWYNNNSTDWQMNTKDITYHYVALLAAT